MKRLWKYIPPCLSDVMGFQAVMNETDGLGIIDDPGRYKPLSTLGVGNDKPAYMNMQARERGGFEGHGGYGGRGGHGGHGERGGKPGGGRGYGADGQRVVDSALRNEDIISGTEKKIVQAFDNCAHLDPKFVLLCNAPSSSMISSDLESAAEVISEKGGIPACNVKIYGDKDYLYGVSITLEAIGKLLLEKAETEKNTVNILGCNIIDWSSGQTESLVKAVEAKGVTILSKWGGKGLTKETVKNAARASLNLVVNVSGMRLARYMESEFGIPYIAGAPFGKEGLDEFTDLMMKTLSGETSDSCIICKGIEGTDDAEVIIAGEQFFCNAIRKDLYNKGYSNIRVISFFEMDKACMVSSDKKISGEDELNEICSKEKVKLVCADPDYRPAVRKEVKWINMPNSGMSMVTRIPQMDLIGQSLDDWISSEL